MSRKNVLGINIFDGWIRAYRTDKLGRHFGWSADSQIEKAVEMRKALKEAAIATRSKGRYAGIVIDHGLVRHQTIDLPHMGARDLNKYLTRKVEQLKEFNEEVAFSYTKSTIKDRLFVSLNIMPKSFAQELEDACRDAGLFLVQIVPFSRVRAQQFLHLPLESDEMAALVIKMYDKVSLIIGKSDGSIFSDRGLKADLDNTEDIDRIVREINRSILYSKQQYGGKVVLIKISERFKENFQTEIREKLGLPVELLPKSQRFFWIKEVLKISPKDPANLVSRKKQRETLIRKNTPIVATVIVTLWIMAFFTAVAVESLLYRERRLLSKYIPQIQALEKEKNRWESRNREVELFKRTVSILEEERPLPIPGYFIGYLGNVLPQGLILTKTKVENVDNRWKVAIEGISMNVAGKTADDLKAFSKNLAEGPFRVRLEKGWHEGWLKQLKEGSASDSGTVRFSFTGTFQ